MTKWRVPVERISFRALMLMEEPPSYHVSEREYDEVIEAVVANRFVIRDGSGATQRVRVRATRTRKVPAKERRFLPSGRSLSKYTLIFDVDWKCSGEIDLEDGLEFSDDDIVEIERAVAADELARLAYNW